MSLRSGRRAPWSGQLPSSGRGGRGGSGRGPGRGRRPPGAVRGAARCPSTGFSSLTCPPLDAGVTPPDGHSRPALPPLTNMEWTWLWASALQGLAHLWGCPWWLQPRLLLPPLPPPPRVCQLAPSSPGPHAGLAPAGERSKGKSWELGWKCPPPSEVPQLPGGSKRRPRPPRSQPEAPTGAHTQRHTGARRSWHGSPGARGGLVRGCSRERGSGVTASRRLIVCDLAPRAPTQTSSGRKLLASRVPLRAREMPTKAPCGVAGAADENPKPAAPERQEPGASHAGMQTSVRRRPAGPGRRRGRLSQSRFGGRTVSPAGRAGVRRSRPTGGKQTVSVPGQPLRSGCAAQRDPAEGPPPGEPGRDADALQVAGDGGGRPGPLLGQEGPRAEDEAWGGSPKALHDVERCRPHNDSSTWTRPSSLRSQAPCF